MDFIRKMVARDLETGKYGGRVVTRFPPEPNGYLHLGHAKAVCLNFGIAAEHDGGRCHLRFDDTNPDMEKAEFVDAIKRDIRWLGFDWGGHLHHASDYFDELYRYAHRLVDKGLAYVDSSTEAEIRERRGSVTEAGTNSPFRNRPPGENRDLFLRMRAGEFPDGSHVLRARIDMSHRNMVMRDPVLYRIRHAAHYRHGARWPIYPMYDFAHCLSDSIEGITHSLCTLEFENNRELYDWLLAAVDAPRPRPEQREFAPLVVDHVVMSKRRLRPLVESGRLRGWDDPRLPTLAGLRRRGVTPAAIRALCDMVGVARAHSRIDGAKLDFAIRNDLNATAPRAFCVLDPLRIVLTNYPEDERETFSAPALPDSPTTADKRALPFRRRLVIDRADFEEAPPPGFRRLAPGREVRLKYACVIRCDEVVKDPAGRIAELRCTVDRDTRGGAHPQGRRVRGAIHWLSEADAVPAEVRLYDRLFTEPEPPLDNLAASINPDSERIAQALVEPGMSGAPPGRHCQFERLGYFFTDPADCADGKLVFNRTVTMGGAWRAARDPGGAPPAQPPPDSDASAPAKRPAPPPGKSPSQAPPQLPEDALRTDAERRSFKTLTALGASPAAAASLAKAPALRDLFFAARALRPAGAASIAAWLVNDVARLAAADPASDPARLAPQALADLASAVDGGDLSHRQGRVVIAALLRKGGSFNEARAGLDLDEIGDEDALLALLREVAAEHPGKAESYRNGKRGLLGFFVGQVMRRTGGKADPRKASELARELLEGAGT